MDSLVFRVSYLITIIGISGIILSLISVIVLKIIGKTKKDTKKINKLLDIALFALIVSVFLAVIPLYGIMRFTD